MVVFIAMLIITIPLGVYFLVSGLLNMAIGLSNCFGSTTTTSALPLVSAITGVPLALIAGGYFELLGVGLALAVALVPDITYAIGIVMRQRRVINRGY